MWLKLHIRGLTPHLRRWVYPPIKLELRSSGGQGHSKSFDSADYGYQDTATTLQCDTPSSNEEP